jgi:ubiquinone/menaquinone biosynthesis C-methylase UbiE
MKWIFKHIARQFRKPTGFGGEISTLAMNCLNQKLYNAVVENIDVHETDVILEIGFGNGYLIRRLSKRCFQKLYGIDISSDMLNVATRKNRTRIEEGRIELKLANVQNLPFDDSSIDKAYTINTVYFWDDLHHGFSEIRRILKPDGIFLNVLYLKEDLDKSPVTQYGFTKFTVEQIQKATNENGLKVERIIEVEAQKSVCVIARKKISFRFTPQGSCIATER